MRIYKIVRRWSLAHIVTAQSRSNRIRYRDIESSVFLHLNHGQEFIEIALRKV